MYKSPPGDVLNRPWKYPFQDSQEIKLLLARLDFTEDWEMRTGSHLYLLRLVGSWSCSLFLLIPYFCFNFNYKRSPFITVFVEYNTLPERKIIVTLDILTSKYY